MSQCGGASIRDCMQKRRSWVRESSQVVLWNWSFLKGSILASSLEEPLSLFYPLHPFQTLCALQSNVRRERLSPLLCQRPGRCLCWNEAGLSLVTQELRFSLDLLIQNYKLACFHSLCQSQNALVWRWCSVRFFMCPAGEQGGLASLTALPPTYKCHTSSRMSGAAFFFFRADVLVV